MQDSGTEQVPGFPILGLSNSNDTQLQSVNTSLSESDVAVLRRLEEVALGAASVTSIIVSVIAEWDRNAEVLSTAGVVCWAAAR